MYIYIRKREWPGFVVEKRRRPTKQILAGCGCERGGQRLIKGELKHPKQTPFLTRTRSTYIQWWPVLPKPAGRAGPDTGAFELPGEICLLAIETIPRGAEKDAIGGGMGKGKSSG